MPAPATFIPDNAPVTFVPDEPESGSLLPTNSRADLQEKMAYLRDERKKGDLAENLLSAGEWATRLVPFRGAVGNVALNTPDPYPIPSLLPLVEADALKAFAKEGLYHLHIPENIIPEPVKGAGEFLAETASGLTTPESILALSTGRPGARLFQAEMIKHSPQAIQAAVEANKKSGPLSAEAVKADLNAAMSVGGPLAIERGLAAPSGVPTLERTGKSLEMPEGAAPTAKVTPEASSKSSVVPVAAKALEISSTPTADELVGMSPDDFKAWAVKTKYGPESPAAIASKMTEADIPKLEAWRDSLNKQVKYILDNMDSKNPDPEDFLQQGKLSFKAGRLNEIVQDFRKKNPEATATPEVAAASKAQEGVSKVVQAEGVESAKDAKTTLVSSLEKAIQDAPSEAEKWPGLAEQRKQGVTDYSKETKKEVGTLTIDIPGDGRFETLNTKEALQAVLDRAKRISTTTGDATKIRRPGISKEDKAWVAEQVAKQSSQQPADISVGPGARSPSDVPIGTQEAQLMDALQKLPEGKEGKDSPRISIADRVADSVASGKDAISKWWLRTKAGAEQYKRLLLGAPRSEDSFWSVKKDWAANRQVNAGVAKEMIEKGKETYPKQIHRQAMGKYAEALMTDNPEAALKAWAAGAKRPANRLQYEAALKLTDEQKQAARQMVQYWESKGQELHEAGLLNHLIEDYAGQHMVDMRASKPPAELNQLRADLVRGTFNTNFKYALQRLFQTEFDLENAGYKLKTTDIFDKLANYAKTANDVLADRAAIRSWMEGETKDGKPLFATGQLRIPIEGAKNDRLMVNPKVRPNPVWKDPKTGEATSVSGEYVKIEHPAFKKWQWAESTPEGKQIFVQGDVWAHKSIADELKNTFGRSHLYDIPGIDTATRLNAQLKGIKLVGFFHQVKTGSHALFHLTRPWAQPKVNPHDAFTYDSMRAGLQLFEARNQEIFSEGMASSSLLQSIANLPKTLTGIEKLGLGDRLRAYQEYLFQDYIPRIKLATYRNALERNLSRYKDKGLDENQIRQITATQINSAFGEMNWRLLGINPTFQHSLRLALLAPDFQAAQHGFAAQLFTKYGGEQRMAAAIMIASVYTGARVLNQIFDDDPHFELKRAFSVVHGKREYGIRTIATDAQRAVSDTAQYIYHRLSPILSATTEGLTRTSAMGKKETGAESLKQIGYRALPIPVTPRPDIGFIDNAISSTLGAYEKRHSAVSDMLQTAHDWKKAHDPAYQAGAVQYPESAYGPIRNALADNDLKTARAEYNKLKQSHSPAKIEQVLSPRAASGHPKPFTSVKHESAFVKSLNDEQRKEYAKALKEREEIYQRFKSMKSLP